MSEENDAATLATPDPAAVKAEMLKIDPAKTGKKRGKRIVLNDPEAPPEIGANTRTIPGIITQRGSTFAAAFSPTARTPTGLVAL